MLLEGLACAGREAYVAPVVYGGYRNASRYTHRMAQLVTRVDDRLAALVDELVGQGLVESRSDAVRRGLAMLVDHHRRQGVAQAIVCGYLDLPQTEEEVGWADRASVQMIADEPW